MGPFPCPNPPSPCETSANPATGFSSEAEDSTTFIGLAWSNQPPALNKPFNLVPCEGIADSPVSQADADRLAQNLAVACANPCGNLFTNTPQTAIGHCADGSAYSLTVPAGLYAAENQVLADRKAFTAAAQSLVGHSICLGGLAPSTVCRSQFYLGLISIAATDLPASTQLTAGSLPDGLVLVSESDRVMIQGTPTTFGVSQFTLTSTSAAKVATSRTYSVSVLGIVTSSALPNANYGAAYNQQLTAYNPNALPVTWKVSAGTLPAGLALDPVTGIISGSVTQGGVFTFTVAAAFPSSICSAQFTINAFIINFDNLVWSGVVVQPGSGQASGLFNGSQFSVKAQGFGVNQAFVEALGSMAYTGPLVHCKAVITTTSGPTSNMGFFIVQDGITVMQVTAADIGTAGVREFDFTIQAGVGSSILVKGIADQGDPTRLFVQSFDNNLGAYSAVLSQIA